MITVITKPAEGESVVKPRSEQLLKVGVRQGPRPAVELVPPRRITRRRVLHLERPHQHVHERHRAEPLTQQRPGLASHPGSTTTNHVREPKLLCSRIQQ